MTALNNALATLDNLQEILEDAQKNVQSAPEEDLPLEQIMEKLSTVDIDSLRSLEPNEIAQVYEKMQVVQQKIEAFEQIVTKARTDLGKTMTQTKKAGKVAQGYAQMNQKGRK